MKIDTPVAFVTGASSGIGRAIATELARQGWNVLLGYGTGSARATELADTLSSTFGVDATPVTIDLRDSASAAATAESVFRVETVSCLVNCAGINDRTPAGAVTLSRAQEVFAVDALSPILLASIFARHLVERGRGGTIVNVTSVHDSVPITGGTLYCGAKAALGMSTKVMALELAGSGIRVNSIAPGETATPMNLAPEGTDAHDIHRPAIPLGRPGNPSEIASIAAFLAGPQSSYVTGASLVVDGGLVLTAAEQNARQPERIP